MADEPRSRHLPLIAGAHSYFMEAVTEWARRDGLAPSARLDSLTKTIRDFLKVVVIDLEPGDNAQVIFETLNARTTPLLALDLVKNLVFRRAEVQGLDLEHLYRMYWRALDEEYWRRTVRQGRLKRPRAEVFLFHWLTMRRAAETPADRLYQHFKTVMEASKTPAIEDLVSEISSDATVFRSFDDQPKGSPEASFFERLAAVDVTTAHPLLLFLFRHTPKVLPRDGLRRCLRLLESWLVRRMLCQMTTKNYNRYFLELLQTVKSRPQKADALIRDALVSNISDTNLWPDDAMVVDAMRTRSLYWSIAGYKIVMVLNALEMSLRTKMAEDIGLPAGLTIQHVMPQKWEKHWGVPEGDQAAFGERIARINRLGNLTLVTKALNPSMSNAPWSKKRDALKQHSILVLNRDICDGHPDAWDEAAIDQRSERLARQVTKIWPGPSARAWS